MPATALRKLTSIPLLSIVLAGIILLAGNMPVRAIDQGGLGGRPARSQASNPRSQSIFVHSLNAGDVAHDSVQVINNTAETKQVLLYAVDSQASSGGAFACAQAADKPLSVGSWITVSKKELTLAPTSKQTVDFSITVPKAATPGEHDGCIVIQDAKQHAAPDGNGIVLSLRSAIRVAITVSGDIQKGLAFTGLTFDRKPQDKLLLSTALRNSGNVSLDTQLHVRLVYPFGLSAVTAGGNFPILSDSEGRFNFETNRPFWGGWLRLTASAAYNDDLKSTLGEGKPTTTIRRTSWVYIAPRPLAAVIEVGLALLFLCMALLLLQKKLKRGQILRHAVSHTVKPHENLHTIAAAYGMSWKQLARINKIKAPYQLKAGQKLIVSSSRNSSKKTHPQQ